MTEKNIGLLSEFLLTDEQLKAVGCLALESTHLELLVESFIIALAGKNAGELLVKRKMIDAKIDIFKDLITPEIKNADLKNKFEKLCSDIKSDIVRRNTAIHGEWNSNENKTLSEWLSKKDNADVVAKRKNSPSTIKSSEIMGLAHRFSANQDNLIGFWTVLQKKSSHKGAE